MNRLFYPLVIGISVLLAGTALDYFEVYGMRKIGLLCLVPFLIQAAMTLYHRSRRAPNG